MRLHKKIAKFFGYNLIKITKNHLTIDDHLASVMNHLGINCVLDVGANIGQYGMSLREHGYKGHIISFEPVKATYTELEKNSKHDPLWQIFPLALGREECTQSIHVTQDSSMASFLDINSYAQERFKHHVANDHSEFVQIKTLDSIWHDLMNALPEAKVFLKLDTQGYDLEVLEGAKCSIPKILGLQSEISQVAIYDGTPDYLTALQKFKSLGFEITGLYPVSRDRKTFRVVEFDCVMTLGKQPQNLSAESA